MVDLKSPFLHARILVYHAHSSDASDNDKDRLHALFIKYANTKLHKFLFVDANAWYELLRHDSDTSPGPGVTPGMLDNASRFIQAVDEMGIKLFNDDPKLQASLQGTWKAPRGHCWRTIDYIGTSRGWQANTAKVLDDFHTLNTKIDHRPIVVDMYADLQLEPNTCKTARARTKISHRTHDLSTGADQFAETLAGAPLPPWHVGHDLHEQAFADLVQYAAEKAFVKKQKTPRSSILSPETWEWVKIKSAVKKFSELFNKHATTVPDNDASSQTFQQIRGSINTLLYTVTKHVRFMS